MIESLKNTFSSLSLFSKTLVFKMSAQEAMGQAASERHRAHGEEQRAGHSTGA